MVVAYLLAPLYVCALSLLEMSLLPRIPLSAMGLAILASPLGPALFVHYDCMCSSFVCIASLYRRERAFLVDWIGGLCREHRRVSRSPSAPLPQLNPRRAGAPLIN